MFKFTLSTIHHSRSLWLPVLLLALVPWMIPFVSPTEEEPIIYQPALAQGAWQTLWVVGTFFSILTAASIGRMFEENKINEYYSSLGTGNLKRFLAQLTPIWGLTSIMGLIPVIICIAGAMPSATEDKNMWVAMQLQAWALWTVSIPVWTSIALALGNRISSPVATVAALLFFYYGKEGIQYLDMVRRNLDANQFLRNVAETGWAAGPHIHFADTTSRMVFKMGPVEPSKFLAILLYLIGASLLVTMATSLVPVKRGAGHLSKAKIGNKAKEKKPATDGKFQKKRTEA